jgi:hypothetical protein
MASTPFFTCRRPTTPATWPGPQAEATNHQLCESISGFSPVSFLIKTKKKLNSSSKGRREENLLAYRVARPLVLYPATAAIKFCCEKREQRQCAEKT